MNSLSLWVAQGFGAGRIPVAPGTFGSLIGLLWFFILLRTGNFWLYVLGTFLGLALSVWLCGKAERILNQTDPGSIVLDEISAMPLCFLVWLGVPWFARGEWPAPKWPLILIIFALFRIMDIAKPWPIRRTQNLRGGWGVTVDDALAAIYVAALSAIPEIWRLANPR
jgi:phosphatidylglycerophosphatase A